ncbi:MAG: galactokinase [Chloroflexi bacterium]|nr:galactokinase [Chloroflexota bacterium]
MQSLPDIVSFENKIRALIGAEKFFQPGKTIYISRAPGRLDLMGGNDDYTGGLVFETTIREATRVAAQPRQDQRFRLLNLDVRAQGWEELVEFSLADLANDQGMRSLEEVRAFVNADAKKQWIAYILGAIYLLKKEYPARINQGASVFLESEVPLGKGVSSSAALEVSAMKALAATYGISIEGPKLAMWTQWVENAIAQSASGVMDQITVVLGDQDHFVPLVCQPCVPEPVVKLPSPMRIWGIDSGVRHSVAGIAYEAARAATFMGYALICDWEGLPVTFDETGALARYTEPCWNGYLANLDLATYRARYEARLPETMHGADFSVKYPTHLDPFTPVRPDVIYPVRACTRYAIEENYRVHLFVELLLNKQQPLTSRTLSLLGELMYEAHQGYTECGLGSVETDFIVNLVRKEGPVHGLYGAKITGGGAGGTVAILGTTSPQSEAAFQRVVSQFCEKMGRTPYIFEGSSVGADRFGIMELT